MVTFSKNEDCPPSQTLLEYASGELSREAGAEIRPHLASCEFCSAEVDFYDKHPLSTVSDDSETVETSEMPSHLFELANALMKKDLSGGPIKKMIDEHDEVLISKGD